MAADHKEDVTHVLKIDPRFAQFIEIDSVRLDVEQSMESVSRTKKRLSTRYYIRASAHCVGSWPNIQYNLRLLDASGLEIGSTWTSGLPFSETLDPHRRVISAMTHSDGLCHSAELTAIPPDTTLHTATGLRPRRPPKDTKPDSVNEIPYRIETASPDSLEVTFSNVSVRAYVDDLQEDFLRVVARGVVMHGEQVVIPAGSMLMADFTDWAGASQCSGLTFLLPSNGRGSQPFEISATAEVYSEIKVATLWIAEAETPPQEGTGGSESSGTAERSVAEDDKFDDWEEEEQL